MPVGNGICQCQSVFVFFFFFVLKQLENVRDFGGTIIRYSVTRRLTKQDKIRDRLDIRLDIRLCLYIDTHSWWPIIITCFVQLPACLLVAIPSSHHSHCRIGLLHRQLSGIWHLDKTGVSPSATGRTTLACATWMRVSKAQSSSIEFFLF